MKSVNLTIGGKLRTFHLGLGFIGFLLEEEKIGFIEFGTQEELNPFKWIPIKMYYSLKYNLIRLGKDDEINFTLKDVIDWIDETDLETIQRFNKAYIDSINKNAPSQPEVKKKVLKK